MMEGQEQASNAMPRYVDDQTLMQEGRQALQQRLGVLGSLRFLRLVSGQNDRFEDIRREWEDISEEELFAVDDPTANP
jgi:hypothetical protein